MYVVAVIRKENKLLPVVPRQLITDGLIYPLVNIPRSSTLAEIS